MQEFSQEKKIDLEILKRKRKVLKKGKTNYFVKRVLKMFKLLLPLSLLAYLLFYSPFFVLSEMETNNLKYIDADEVLSDFEILKGENFFLTDLSVLRTDVIKKYAFVERVYTEKVFPDRVLINIREKEPYFLANNSQGCFLLDKEGFVLLQGDCNILKSNHSVKELFGTDLDNIDFKVNTQSNFYNAKYIYEIVNILDYYGHNVKTVEVEEHMANFELHDSKTFIFSLLDDIEIQLKRLVVIVKKLEADEMVFKSIDLRYQRPVLIEK